MERIITYSSATTYCQCARKYYWRYELGLRPKIDEESEALRDGIHGHDILRVYLSSGWISAIAFIGQWRESQPAIGEDATRELDQRAAKLSAMIRAVSMMWPAGEQPRAEVLLTAPVRMPSGRKLYCWTFRGKADAVDNSRLIDWKFTSDPTRTIRELDLSFQAELYASALLRQGVTLTTVHYRLIHVPQIKFCGKDADAAAYEDRALALLQEPGRLQTHEAFLNQARIAKATSWICEVAQQISYNRKKHLARALVGPSSCWLGNRLACHDWSRTCEYYPLCSAMANGADVDWLIGENYAEGERHPELSEA